MRLVTGYAASSQAKSQPPRPIAGAGDFLLKEEDFPPLRPSAKAAAAQVATEIPAIAPSPSHRTPLPQPLSSGPQVQHCLTQHMVLSGSDTFKAENYKEVLRLIQRMKNK